MINEIKYLELLKEFMESENIAVLEDLKEQLEEEIRKSGALKTNSKSRYSALKRLEKRVEKASRLNLKGYAVKDNKYWFTDSYMYAVLKDSCNFEENKNSFPIESLSNIDFKIELEKLDITLEDLSYAIKTKTDYKNDIFKGKDYQDKEVTYSFDYKYLKDIIDIIGNKDIKIYTNKNNKNMIILMNKDIERVVLLGKINY